MNIVFFGTDSFGIPALEAIHRSPHKLVSLVTTPDKPQGRRLELTCCDVKRWATDQSLPFIEMTKENSKERLLELSRLNADVFVVVSFGVILPKELLELPKRAALNIHPSLLPKYRGPSPIQAALLNADTRTGVSIIRMVEKLDAGDLMLQRSVTIEAGEDAVRLEKGLSDMASRLILEALSLLESGQARFEPQRESQASYAKKIKKEDGRILWDQPALSITNHVRAMKGWPGSFCFYGGKRVILSRIEVSADQPVGTAVPGQVLEASYEKGLLIAASDHPVRVVQIQVQGRKPLRFDDFLRGFSISVGSRFE